MVKEQHFTPLILVVDDSISSRKVLLEVLGELPVDIIEAENGQQGVDLAIEHLPDLILMDYRMPEMDGPQAVSLIREHSLAGRIPVLMITGETDSEKMLTGYQSGVLDYIYKPFDPVRMKAQVQSYLQLAVINRRFVLATMDRVTERPNLLALQEDVEAESGRFPLVLMRSREVSAIRKLYGATIGDELEKQVCQRIENNAAAMFKVQSKLYVIDRGSLVLRFLDEDGWIDEQSAPTIMRAFEHHLSSEEFEVENLMFTCDFRMVISLPGPGVLDDALVAFEDGRDNMRGPSLVFAGEVVARHREAIHQNLNTLTTIRNSLREDQVVAYAQPLVELGTAKVIGYECLMRLRDSSGVIMAPWQFLDVAKGSRYYPDLTIQMLLQACDAFAKASCLCTLNYSIVDIENERVVQKTMDILKENPGFASRLVIELVEQEDGSDFELVADFMRDVRQLGAQVAIDDFGSGYSNLRRLMELDFNYVKIDGSLVRDITVSQRAKQLTDWVVGFAEQAKVKLIAEFVETEEHRRLLLDAGVDLGQGYLFGRPEPLRVIKQKL